MPIEDFDKPGQHPQPPDDLNTRELPTIEIGSPLWRIHQSRYHPIYFGKTGQYRFDAPDAQYGVLYAGVDELCAFRETIGTMAKYRIVTKSLLMHRQLSMIETQKPLKLIDLTGAGLTKIDADGRLCTGDYRIAQEWSATLWLHPSGLDGLYYRSRHDPSRYCVAIYDRASSGLSVKITFDLWSDSFRLRLASILDTYDYAFIDN